MKFMYLLLLLGNKTLAHALLCIKMRDNYIKEELPTPADSHAKHQCWRQPSVRHNQTLDKIEHSVPDHLTDELMTLESHFIGEYS